MTEQKQGMSKGCLIALVAGIIILIIAIGLAVVCFVYKDRIIELGLTTMMNQVADEIKADLPEGVTAEEVDRLIEDFSEAYRNNRIDEQDIKEISAMISGMLNDRKVDHDEAQEFIDRIGEVIE